MNSQQKNQLRHELQTAGASSTEMDKLISIAGNFNRLKSERAQSHLFHQQRTFLFFALPSLFSLVIGMALIVFSQAALPGSALFPLQKLTDNVSVSVEPSYRATIMMKRAAQVKLLVSRHASSSVVLATLQDYKGEAAIYKSISANYPAFEYCRSNLQQALVAATSSEKQAITVTLNSLGDS